MCSLVSAFALFGAVVHVYSVASPRYSWKSWERQKAQFAIYILCFLATFIRIFYFALDPYTYHFELSYCAFYAIDYVSSDMVAMAYAFMTYTWTVVVYPSVSKLNPAVGVAVKVAQIWSLVMVGWLVIAPCAISWYCVCPNGVCDYSAA
jgi:hypothetical protein